MNTSDNQMNEAEMQKLQKELHALQAENARLTQETMKLEIKHLRDVLSVIDVEDIVPEMLVIQMHNIISIAPEEQYRFHKDIYKMFLSFPVDVRNANKDIVYLSDRLGMMKEEDLNSKAFQITDLSRYWSSYRMLLYRLNYQENSKQIKAQKHLHKEMIAIAKEIIAKREQGIITANKLIENAGL